MKRIGGLYDRIGQRCNLARALWRAALGRRGCPEVAETIDGAESLLVALGAALRSEGVCFGPYRAFEVRDTKRRDIMAPPFDQRVLHHAMLAVLGPVLERSATDRSFACRRGYGQHRAIARARDFARRGDWYLKLDVHRYYDSIRHDGLLAALRKRFRERRVLRLWARLIDSYHASEGRGLPIGALTSQYLSNFFLDPLDHRILSSPSCQLPSRAYLRYMDDIVVWGTRDELRRVLDEVRQWLGARGLTLKHGGELQPARTGAPWLGFIVYPGRVRLGRAARKRLARRCRQARRIRDAAIQHSCLTSLFAWAEQADDLSWRRAMLERQNEYGEAQGQDAGASRRFLEQRGGPCRLGLPQQGSAR